MINNVMLVYFSGTGGTERIVNAFENELLKRDCIVSKVVLDYSKQASSDDPDSLLKSCDLVILLFPVHAFDAPLPIYHWIEKVNVANKKIAVLSVSGGGEAWPNTGCRNNCCKALEEKGFDIIYEKMMVMPSNWVFNVNDHKSMWLIKVIPDKVSQILDSIFQGKIRRTHFKKGFLQKYITKLEKDNANKFAEDLKIDNNCFSCGSCAKCCPVNNIEIVDKKPVFKDKCVMCFRCIYACPSKAIKSNNFMVLKSGYNLKDVETRMKGIQLPPIEKCFKGIMWKAVKNYLLDKDGC